MIRTDALFSRAKFLANADASAKVVNERVVIVISNAHINRPKGRAASPRSG